MKQEPAPVLVWNGLEDMESGCPVHDEVIEMRDFLNPQASLLLDEGIQFDNESFSLSEIATEGSNAYTYLLAMRYLVAIIYDTAMAAFISSVGVPSKWSRQSGLKLPRRTRIFSNFGF